MCWNRLRDWKSNTINRRFKMKRTTFSLRLLIVHSEQKKRNETKLNCLCQSVFFQPSNNWCSFVGFSFSARCRLYFFFSPTLDSSFTMNNSILCVTNIIKANYSCLANANIKQNHFRNGALFVRLHSPLAQLLTRSCSLSLSLFRRRSSELAARSLRSGAVLERHSSYSSQLTMNALLTFPHCVALLSQHFGHPFVLDFDFIFMFAKLLIFMANKTAKWNLVF